MVIPIKLPEADTFAPKPRSCEETGSNLVNWGEYFTVLWGFDQKLPQLASQFQLI
jgi:hypothetical protein